MTYKPHPIKTEGGLDEIPVSDDDSQGLLIKILKELQKLNIHMELITNEYIDNTEVE